MALTEKQKFYIATMLFAFCFLTLIIAVPLLIVNYRSQIDEEKKKYENAEEEMDDLESKYITCKNEKQTCTDSRVKLVTELDSCIVSDDPELEKKLDKCKNNKDEIKNLLSLCDSSKKILNEDLLTCNEEKLKLKNKFTDLITKNELVSQITIDSDKYELPNIDPDKIKWEWSDGDDESKYNRDYVIYKFYCGKYSIDNSDCPSAPGKVKKLIIGGSVEKKIMKSENDGDIENDLFITLSKNDSKKPLCNNGKLIIFRVDVHNDNVLGSYFVRPLTTEMNEYYDDRYKDLQGDTVENLEFMDTMDLLE